MKNNNDVQNVKTGIIVLVLGVSLLRGCVDQDYGYRYNNCMAGTNTVFAPFKAVFVCIWS
jgi:hypothetical protein